MCSYAHRLVSMQQLLQRTTKRICVQEKPKLNTVIPNSARENSLQIQCSICGVRDLLFAVLRNASLQPISPPLESMRIFNGSNFMTAGSYGSRLNSSAVNHSAARSSHVGLIDLISATRFSLLHPLSSFSLAIAVLTY